jgi:hypothetical protein
MKFGKNKKRREDKSEVVEEMARNKDEKKHGIRNKNEEK